MTDQEVNELLTRVQVLERKAEDDHKLIIEAVKLSMKALRAGLGIDEPNKQSDPKRHNGGA